MEVTREDFEKCEVADLLINVWSYDKDLKYRKHKKICMMLPREQWKDEWLSLKTVIKNLYNWRKFNFGKIATCDFYKSTGKKNNTWDGGWDSD